jgi:hypothetical protein
MSEGVCPVCSVDFGSLSNLEGHEAFGKGECATIIGIAL